MYSHSAYFLWFCFIRTHWDKVDEVNLSLKRHYIDKGNRQLKWLDSVWSLYKYQSVKKVEKKCEQDADISHPSQEHFLLFETKEVKFINEPCYGFVTRLGHTEWNQRLLTWDKNMLIRDIIVGGVSGPPTTRSKIWFLRFFRDEPGRWSTDH